MVGMNCVIMQMRTHYFRGHTEKKGGGREGEWGREERGGRGGGSEEFGKGVGRERRERGGREIEEEGEREWGKEEGRGREISLTAAKQSHLPDSSHAQ